MELSLTFVPGNKLSFKEFRQTPNDYVLFPPNTRWDEDTALAQIKSTSTTTETEELKARIVEKVQAVHDYSGGLHTRIQSIIFPKEYYMDVHVPSICITSLIAISHIRAKRHFPNLYLSFSPEYFPTELIHLTINSIQSKATTTEDQDIGHFARINMNTPTTWDEW